MRLLLLLLLLLLRCCAAVMRCCCSAAAALLLRCDAAQRAALLRYVAAPLPVLFTQQDPASKKLRDHIGTHPQIIEGLFRRRDLINFPFAMIKRFLNSNETSLQRRSHVYIGVFCNSGTHRSVALTLLLGLTIRI